VRFDGNVGGQSVHIDGRLVNGVIRLADAWLLK